METPSIHDDRWRVSVMTVRRWLVGSVILTILGSVVVDFGHQPVQVALAETIRTGGYCANELNDGDAANMAAQNRTAADRQNEGVTRANSSTSKTDSESTTKADADSELESGNSTAKSGCPADMVEVSGDYCQVVEQICEEYISEKKDRCAKYRNKVRCFGKSRSLHFCVDRYEYPNQAGVKPTVAVTWDEARELCATEGKRLCTADEWTQACEGPEHSPYPYGFTRNGEACNHDKPYIIPDDNAYQNPQTRAKEVARVNQSEPSGSRPGCASAYGVFDMTGNVDEWVLNESGNENGPEFQSGLKGGYWGPVRNRCRPATTDHNRWHHGYQIGFRCCADPGHSDKAPGQPSGAPDRPGDDEGRVTGTDLVTRS